MTFEDQLSKVYSDKFRKCSTLAGARQLLAERQYTHAGGQMWRKGKATGWLTPLARGYLITWDEFPPLQPILCQKHWTEFYPGGKA